MTSTRLLLAFIISTAFHVHAAEAPKPKPAAYLNDDEARAAGPDFDLQGEFTDGRIGAQVISLGNDTFRAVFHKGGLPGDGWDKSAKVEIEAKRDGNNVEFTLFCGTKAPLTKGTLKGEYDGKLFTLKKVHRTSPTLGTKPPAGATVLFDGSNADAWQNGKMDERHFLRCGTKSKMTHGSGTLHIEFFLPFKPLGRGQDRGNSGVYLQDRYEVQVLDSFGLKGENNECGGIYTKHRPLVNMCFPPLTWQTYDIEFEAATFADDGKKAKNAVLTVRHNGVLIHDHAEVNSTTTAAGINTETPTDGPIQLQDHGNPIYYRNIWWLPKK